MTIRHHVSYELLMDYAGGALEESWSLVVATHLALCPSCRARLRTMEAAGGVLLEAIDAESEPETDRQSWEAIKMRLAGDGRGGEASSPAREKRAEVPAQVPEPLRSYLGGELDQLRWRALGLGAYHYPVATSDKDISVRLLRIPAGKPVPEHSHGGRELTLVLSGAFADGEDRFGPGDFEETDETVNHQPIAEAGEDCICLAVTDAPLRFKSKLVRLIQPLIGI